MIAHRITQDSNPSPLGPSPPLPTPRAQAALVVGAKFGCSCLHAIESQVNAIPCRGGTLTCQVLYEFKWTEAGIVTMYEKYHAQADKLWQFENWYANLKVEGYSNTILKLEMTLSQFKAKPSGTHSSLALEISLQKSTAKVTWSRSQFIRDPAHFARKKALSSWCNCSLVNRPLCSGVSVHVIRIGEWRPKDWL